MIRISPEIDWYHYQGVSLAPMCLVRHQTITKTPTRWSVISEPSVPPPLNGGKNEKLYLPSTILAEKGPPTKIEKSKLVLKWFLGNFKCFVFFFKKNKQIIGQMLCTHFFLCLPLKDVFFQVTALMPVWMEISLVYLSQH